MKSLPVLFLSCFLIYSCTRYKIPEDVTAILKATKNGKELFKTLNHYNNRRDSLKFDATCFLIRNMIDKGYFAGRKIDCIDQFFTQAINKQKVSGSKVSEKELEAIWDTLYTNCTSPSIFKYDIDEINYRQLRNNIDESFDLWEKMSYNKHVSYQSFLNNILAYRIGHEKFENYKEIFSGEYKNLIDSLKTFNDPVKACEFINNKMMSSIRFFTRLVSYPGNISFSNIRNSGMGVCEDMANITTIAMRSVGIPVTIDYSPKWGNMNTGHTWNVVFDTTGKTVRFMGTESNPGTQSQYWETEKPAKIFRRTYELQRDSEKIFDYQLNIPPLLTLFDYIDVTDYYVPVSDVTIELKNIPANTTYAYVAVYNRNNWAPIYWGKIKKGHVTFPKLGRDIIYLPVYCINQTYKVASYPFLLTKTGEVKNLIIGNEVNTAMKLTSKYPLFPRIRRYMNRMINGRFQGANKPDFSDSVNLYIIKDPPGISMSVARININKKFKYVRYIGPDNGYSDISEMEVYSNSSKGGRLIKLTGKIIGQGENNKIFNEAFDDDWVTYFYSVSPGKKNGLAWSLTNPCILIKLNICRVPMIMR